MSDLFTADWMNNYKDRWNADSNLAGALSKIGFNSTIGYGYDGEDAPRGFIRVENGQVVEAGDYTDQELNWDLRASATHWNKWMNKPPGMMGLGIAYTSRKLKFNVGDYTAMIKDPRMAGPFIRSFAAMGG
ncbi:hypothetical protein MNBD_GAMMA13-1830 [hydrothermal vent metagenome]|uniref:SCP-2 sterol transfer family protein n=1 Tax=hydrothermal vent metagenome TaxID=652676 RepID=A0A3B0YQ11_9ZZZZ